MSLSVSLSVTDFPPHQVKIAYMGALAASSHVPSEVRPEYMLRYLLAALEGEERAPPMPTPAEVLQLKLLHWRERRDELAALQVRWLLASDCVLMATNYYYMYRCDLKDE